MQYSGFYGSTWQCFAMQENSLADHSVTKMIADNPSNTLSLDNYVIRINSKKILRAETQMSSRGIILPKR